MSHYRERPAPSPHYRDRRDEVVRVVPTFRTEYGYILNEKHVRYAGPISKDGRLVGYSFLSDDGFTNIDVDAALDAIDQGRLRVAR